MAAVMAVGSDQMNECSLFFDRYCQLPSSNWQSIGSQYGRHMGVILGAGAGCD